MPFYDYECKDCQSKAESIKGSKLTIEEMSEVMFETSHAMVPKPEELAEATKCPRCGSNNTIRSLLALNTIVYARGSGWLDKSGYTRDRNLHKITTDDPYAEYRTTGEVDHIANEIKKSGQFNPKTEYYVQTPPPPASDTKTE